MNSDNVLQPVEAKSLDFAVPETNAAGEIKTEKSQLEVDLAASSPDSFPLNVELDGITTSDRLMIVLTTVITLCTVISTWTSVSVLNEMKSGSQDTRELAMQAKSSADATKRIAETAIIQSKAISALVDVGRNQAESTRDIAERAVIQASATNELAKAANTQSTIAKKALVLSASADRPWIGMATPNFTLELGKPTEVSVAVVNSGRSPAHITQFVVTMTIDRTLPKNPTDFPFTRNDASQTLLSPGNLATNTTKVPALSKEQYEGISNRSLTLFVHCYVKYEDIRTRANHTTEGYFYWDNSLHRLINAPDHNDAT